MTLRFPMQAGIPPEAMFYSFCYPASATLKLLPEDVIDLKELQKLKELGQSATPPDGVEKVIEAILTLDPSVSSTDRNFKYFIDDLVLTSLLHCFLLVFVTVV